MLLQWNTTSDIHLYLVQCLHISPTHIPYRSTFSHICFPLHKGNSPYKCQHCITLTMFLSFQTWSFSGLFVYQTLKQPHHHLYQPLLHQTACTSEKSSFRLFTTQAGISVSVIFTSHFKDFFKCCFCILQNEMCEGPSVAVWDVWCT